MFEVVLDVFLVVSLVSSMFKLVLVCVFAVVGRAWPSWFVVFGVTSKLVWFGLIQIVLVVLMLFFDRLQLSIGNLKTC